MGCLLMSGNWNTGTTWGQVVPREVHEQDGKSELEDTQRFPAHAHMATSHDEDERFARGAHTHIHMDDHWSPACTHMNV